MPVDKLIPQYLNKDEDVRLVENTQMTDALNIRVSTDDNGNQGVLKNVEGNSSVPAARAAEAIPASGVNRVIGSVASEAGKCIYFFLYNSLGNHGIYQYRYTTDKYYKVYENSVLNFNLQDFVKADVVINQFDEHLLYFTDNRNEPRKINATKALNGGYSVAIDSGSISTRELFLTVCKQPPQTPITFEFVDEDNNQSNHLKNNVFQFAYQYVYDDGEISALSAYSELAFSDTNLAHNITLQSSFEDKNNALDLTLQGSQGPVTKLRVFARRNNDQAFYRIGEIDNPGSGSTIFRFKNDGVFNLLPDQDAFKLFDSVPRQAFSQAISNNRLFYGNYVEGFDNIKTDTFTYPVYNPSPLVLDLPGERGPVETNLTDFADEADFYDFHFGNPYGIGVTTVEVSDDLVNFEDGNGSAPAIEIDLSDIVNSDSLQSGVVNFDASFDFDEMGIGASGVAGLHFDYPISFVDDDGNPDDLNYTVGAALNELPNSLTLNMMAPRQLNGSFEYINNNEHIGATTAISNLSPPNPVTFSTSFTTSDISSSPTQTIEEAFASELISNINGLESTFFVKPDSDEVITTLGITEEVLQAFGASQFRVVFGLNFDGFATIQLYGGSFFLDGDTPKVRFKLRVTNLSLNLKSYNVLQLPTGFAGSDLVFGTLAGGSSYNLFESTSNQYESSNIVSGVFGGAGFQNSLGLELKDNGDLNGDKITTAYRGFKLLKSQIEFSNTLSESTASFKAGATHDFGIVYYDHRNRASGVQKIDSVDVAHFGDSTRSGNEGNAKVDIRILHEPPAWASKWAPVYSKNTTYEKILQIGVAEAAMGTQTTFEDPLSANTGNTARPIISALSEGTQGVIYLSLRTLEGKVNSYKESFGANLSYQYQEGDMLRVIECLDGDAKKIRPLLEFPISSYEFYVDDDKNPIKLTSETTENDENDYRRTGHFLAIRDEGFTNFSRTEVAAGTDFFKNQCIVEIYRPKSKIEDQVFFEVGKCFDIVTVDGERTHAGDRSNSASPSFDITVTGETSFVSTQRLYLGDRVDTVAANTGFVYVNSIRLLDDGRFRYGINSSSPFFVDGFINTVVSASVFLQTGSPVSVFPGVITLDMGDVYLRRRSILTSPIDSTTKLPDVTKPDEQVYKTFFVEDESVSDFFESKAVSVGRPHIETPDQKEIRRFSSVTYSDVFTLDNSVLNLSSFNPSLFPFKDYNTQHGDICYLLDRNESLMVMQESKISATPISRVLIEDAGGGQLVTSQNVMGTPTYYAGDYGPGLQPESVVERFGLVYFADVSRAAVIQIGGKGIAPISSKHMQSYFQDKLGKVDSIAQSAKLPAGFDPDNTEYVLSITEIDRVTVSVPTDDGGDLSDVVRPTSSTTDKGDAVVDVIYAPNGGNTWDGEPDRWQLDAMNWEDSGNGILFLDRLGEKGSAILHTDYQGTTASVNIKVSVFGGDLTGVTSISPKDNSIAIPSTLTRQSDSGTVAVTQTVVSADVSGETVAWSPTKQVWLTFYSFVPELYAHLHDRFFSFVNGQIWKHNVNATMNNFYGSQYSAKATVVSKLSPSMVKVYDSISLEGDNGSWNFVVSNSTQTTPTTSPTLIEKEEMWYSRIPSDSTAGSTLNTAHKVVLGQVSAIDGSTITFSSRISNLPFGIGDSLFKLASSSETDLSLTISSVSGRKEITASGTVGGLVVGDTVMAVSDNNINGDDIRDYYAQIALTNASTTPLELYAVNTWFTPSPLHNEK